jgi:hypothetical protein
VTRLLALAGATVRPYRFTGRFAFLRHIYSYWRSRLPATDVGHPAESLVRGLDPGHAAATLSAHGLHVGFGIPPAMAGRLVRFAREARLVAPGTRRIFRHADVAGARLADGTPVPLADVKAPLDCAEIRTLRHDPVLLSAISRVLGYRPPRVSVRLFWSFAGAMADDDRRRLGQTIDYHYDVPWFNAVYAYFYLTGADRQSGAHQVIPASLHDMPKRFLVSGCFRSRAELLEHYGPDCEFAVEGPAGTGFLENPFIFHRAIPPDGRDRLMLQFRYH